MRFGIAFRRCLPCLIVFTLVAGWAQTADDTNPDDPDQPARKTTTKRRPRRRPTTGTSTSTSARTRTGTTSTKGAKAETDEETPKTGEKSDRKGTKSTTPRRAETPDVTEEPAEDEFDQRVRQYYPPRPTWTTPPAGVDELLDEIEDEVVDMQPLYGQGVFRQAIIDRAVRSSQRTIASPPPATYQLYPGDRLVVSFWNAFVDPVHAEVTVQSDGTVGFDPVGVVPVAGLTVTDFETLLTKLVRSKGPRDATVRFSYTDLRAVRVSVRGEVRRVSGSVVLAGYPTLFDALAAAGGPRAFASLRHIKLYRGNQVQEIDLYRFLNEGDPASNTGLRDGDSIFVPVADRLIDVSGEVARPARYELRDEQTMAQVLALAGGLRGRAVNLQLIRLKDGQEQYSDYPLPGALDGSVDVKAVWPLRNGDALVAMKAGLGKRAIKVSGAVGLPGDYGFETGMTLRDALTKAQGVPPTGHAGVGTITRARPDGQLESINFEVAEALAGGLAGRTPLKAGDVVDIPKATERASLTVVVTGAVNRPGLLELQTAHTVGDLLTQAQGLAAGAATSATLLSQASGKLVETRIDLTPMQRGGAPKPNPEVANGDRLYVPYLADTGLLTQVRVAGLVRTPGTYLLATGMKVADLLERAGGLLPRAAQSAKLSRIVPGTNQTEVRYLDVTKAATGDAEQNLALRSDDLLEVVAGGDDTVAREPRVTIRGLVARPGRYDRHQGMKLADLLREAGGLELEADRDSAELQRQADHGRVRVLRFSPARALAGAEQDNLELQDGDVVQLTAWEEVRVARPTVRVVGSVYNPGSFALTVGMTLDDLLYRAAGTTPEAYLPRAELWRRGDNGRPRVVPFDLSAKPLLAPLRDGDELRVMTQQQAVYREPSVEIRGEVQHPGKFERTEGMRLSELIFRAGGLTRNVSFTTCEVARAGDRDVVPMRPDLRLLLGGDDSQDIELLDGDSVFVRTYGDIQQRPKQVLVRGRLKLPGFYPLTGRDDSLRALVTVRAQGMLDGAFVEGAILLRRVDEIVDSEVARYGSEIYKWMRDKKQRNDRAMLLTKGVAPGAADRLIQERVLPTEVVRSSLATDLGDESEELTRATRTLEQIDQARSERPAQRPAPAPTRVPTGPNQQQPPAPTNDRDKDAGLPPYDPNPTPEILKQYVRVAIDLPAILAGKGDLQMCPNDILVIPQRPQLIMVQGEVASNIAQPYIEGQTVLDYIRHAGGTTPDANSKDLIVVRADGTLTQAVTNTVVHRGDIVLVPPKPLKLPTERRTIDDISAWSSLLGGLGTAAVAINSAFK